MRREVAICAALAALAAPSQAAAQTPSCTTPKGWSTASAQLQYDLYKEMGIVQMRFERYVPPPGSVIDTAAFVRRLPQNAVDIGAGTVESAFYATAAVATFGVNVATATVNEPPSCSVGKRRRR